MGISPILKMQNGAVITYQVMYGHKWTFYAVWSSSEVSYCMSLDFSQHILLHATHNESQTFIWMKQYKLFLKKSMYFKLGMF